MDTRVVRRVENLPQECRGRSWMNRACSVWRKECFEGTWQQLPQDLRKWLVGDWKTMDISGKKESFKLDIRKVFFHHKDSQALEQLCCSERLCSLIQLHRLYVVDYNGIRSKLQWRLWQVWETNTELLVNYTNCRWLHCRQCNIFFFLSFPPPFMIDTGSQLLWHENLRETSEWMGGMARLRWVGIRVTGSVMCSPCSLLYI